mmetsp:Transcript_21811/g.88846  ORF Transcript_21811/g.88846 Transcript_21811/m.88846 type:complete len:94 (+) Transcript_21811:429-710(+)
MTKNIEARGSPLMGLSAYPSAQSQKERFQKLNFNKVAAISMLEYYSKCAESLQDNVKLRIRVFLVLELIRMVKLVQEMLIQLFPMVAQVCKRI